MPLFDIDKEAEKSRFLFRLPTNYDPAEASARKLRAQEARTRAAEQDTGNMLNRMLGKGKAGKKPSYRSESEAFSQAKNQALRLKDKKGNLIAPGDDADAHLLKEWDHNLADLAKAWVDLPKGQRISDADALKMMLRTRGIQMKLPLADGTEDAITGASVKAPPEAAPDLAGGPMQIQPGGTVTGPGGNEMILPVVPPMEARDANDQLGEVDREKLSREKLTGRAVDLLERERKERQGRPRSETQVERDRVASEQAEAAQEAAAYKEALREYENPSPTLQDKQGGVLGGSMRPNVKPKAPEKRIPRSTFLRQRVDGVMRGNRMEFGKDLAKWPKDQQDNLWKAVAVQLHDDSAAFPMPTELQVQVGGKWVPYGEVAEQIGPETMERLKDEGSLREISMVPRLLGDRGEARRYYAFLSDMRGAGYASNVFKMLRRIEELQEGGK